MVPNQKWKATYTQWDTFHGCPYRFQEQYLNKNCGRQTSEALDKGIRVHDALEHYVDGSSDVLPPEVDISWKRTINALRKEHTKGTVSLEVRVENDIAYGKIDVLTPLAIRDWKTGKARKNDLDKREQLRFYRWLVKDDQPLECSLWWVEHKYPNAALNLSMDWTTTLDRVWRKRITEMWAGDYPMRTSWKCKYCSVMHCPNNTAEKTT